MLSDHLDDLPDLQLIPRGLSGGPQLRQDSVLLRDPAKPPWPSDHLTESVNRPSVFAQGNGSSIAQRLVGPALAATRVI